MIERELQKVIRDLFMQGFAAQNIAIRVQRTFQQRNHSAPDVPTLGYHRITTTPVGWQYRRVEKTGEHTGRETHYSNELITYQFNALVVEPSPENESMGDMTAADLLRTARMIAVTQRPRLKSLGINILAINTIAEVQVQNESDNWEYQPSFDITFSVKQELTTDVGRVTEFTHHIYQV